MRTGAMPDNLYEPGTKVRLSVVFSSAGAETDPTTVTLKVRTPAGVVTSYTWAGAQVTKDAVGRFHMDLSVTASGRYYYRWIGTGTVETSVEASFRVKDPVIP